MNDLPLAKCAAYNSKSGLRSCTADTRDKVLASLVAWATDACDKMIYWFRGVAGTGKTTIAFTFSQILDNMQMLGASFFCSRLDIDSSNAELIFPTLAYELAHHSTAASNALLNALESTCGAPHEGLGTIIQEANYGSRGLDRSRLLLHVTSIIGLGPLRL